MTSLVRFLFDGPLIETRQATTFGHILKVFFPVLEPDVFDFVETAKRQRFVLVNRRPDVLAVVAVFHLVQLPHTRHVGQTRL